MSRVVLGLDLSKTPAWAVRGPDFLSWGSTVLTAPKPATKTRAKSHPGERFTEMLILIRKLVADHRPTVIAYEVPGGGTSRYSSMLLYGFRGIVYAVAHHYRIPVMEIHPGTLKLWATGKGNADKKLMADAWVSQADKSRALYMPGDQFPSNDDEIDACWLAEWGWQTSSKKG